MTNENSPEQQPPMKRNSLRDLKRLTRAAWGVGITHEWFLKSPYLVQVGKVQEWVDETLEQAAERRARNSGTGERSRYQ